jgi:hypothetical protein
MAYPTSMHEFAYLVQIVCSNSSIAMKNSTLDPVRSIAALLLWMWLPAMGLLAQSDRPCGAPLMVLTDCSVTTPLALGPNAFQAADAPIPVGCNAAYSHDAWLRVVAPSSDVTISFVMRNFGFSGTPPTPSQVNALFYTPTPDCNNLVNPIGCATNCPLALVCITLDGMEGHANARRYIGLTAGNTYYLRVLWNPVFTSVFDTVRLSFASTTCNICDPCGGIDVVLGDASNHFSARWENSQATLRCSTDDLGFEPNFLRSKDTKVWESVAQAPRLDGADWVVQDHATLPGQQYYYRAQFVDANGGNRLTDIAVLKARSKPWLQAATWQPEALQLNLALEGDARLQCYDLNGALLTEILLPKEETRLTIPKANLGSGLLVLKLSGNFPSKSELISGWQR